MTCGRHENNIITIEILLFFIIVKLREVILKKKLLTYGHFPKEGGGGVQPKSKSFWVVFFGPSFGHYGGKGGVGPIPKDLG